MVFSKVVLPEPVPPLISTLHREAPITPRTRAPSGLMEPYSTRLRMVSLSLRNFRMVRVGPSSARGEEMTLTREPSGRRASQMGEDSSTRRADLRDDPLADVHQLGVVAEADVGQLHTPRSPR